MTRKLAKVLDGHREEVAEDLHGEIAARIEQDQIISAGEEFGAIRAAGAIGQHLSAAAFRGLQQWLEAGNYRLYGYEDITHFLNEYPKSPMRKNQYYDRLALIESEGDQAFEVLNSLKVPIATRKLLKGDIEIDGDIAHIGDVEIDLTDKAKVKEAFRSLDSQLKASGQQIEKGKKDVEKYKRLADQAQWRGPMAGTPHGQALLTLAGAYTNLRDVVLDYRESVPPDSDGDPEFRDFYKVTMETIGNSYRELIDAFDITSTETDGIDV